MLQPFDRQTRAFSLTVLSNSHPDAMGSGCIPITRSSCLAGSQLSLLLLVSGGVAVRLSAVLGKGGQGVEGVLSLDDADAVAAAR